MALEDWQGMALDQAATELGLGNQGQGDQANQGNNQGEDQDQGEGEGDNQAVDLAPADATSADPWTSDAAVSPDTPCNVVDLSDRIGSLGAALGAVPDRDQD
jgi:hypothetical protein